jgi:hypothetical protein
MIKHFIFLLLICGCNSNPTKPEKIIIQQSLDSIKYYKTILRHDLINVTFDTIVSLDFVDSNPDSFHAFKYPKLDRVNIGENIMELFNDSIRVRIEKVKIEPENRLTLTQTEDYFKNTSGKRYFGVGVIWPQEKLTKIIIEINRVKKTLSSDSFDDLLDPNFTCNPNFIPQCYINVYTTDKGEVLLTIRGGEASGSYLAIFVFDKTGNLLKRIARQLSP